MSPMVRIRRRIAPHPAAYLSTMHRVEDALFTFLSVAVVAIVVTMLLLPPQLVLTLRVEEAGAAPLPHKISVYGSVLDETGAPVENALVEIFDDSGQRVFRDTTGVDGFYEKDFVDKEAPYTVRITLPGGLVSEVVVAMTPGMIYGVSGVVDESGVLVIAPIPGY